MEDMRSIKGIFGHINKKKEDLRVLFFKRYVLAFTIPVQTQFYYPKSFLSLSSNTCISCLFSIYFLPFGS